MVLKVTNAGGRPIINIVQSSAAISHMSMDFHGGLVAAILNALKSYVRDEAKKSVQKTIDDNVST